MINFLDPIFNPKVICDKNSTDNYEPQNLISQNFMEKARGFVAYSTVKPPVEIEFEIICPIHIDFISINTTVGNHKCSGIEIFVKSDKTYTSIGKAVYCANGIVFCSSVKYSKINLPPNIPSNYHVCFLNKSRFVSTNVKLVKIRIFQTVKYVPCLGSVEIWGSVSNNCSEITKNTIKILCEKLKHSYDNTLVPAMSLCASNSDKNSEKLLGIPEDFKDELTFEIMTLPVTLPSGKTIDQSTLEKHIESEKTFGRKPGDPFTGLKFTENMKPMLNVALKSRIDMYLLQNSTNPQFLNLGRTVGRANNQTIGGNCVVMKKIKLDNNDEISLDVSELKFKQFIEEHSKCCVICKTAEILYIIPCKHLYCRTCVDRICGNLKCKKCFLSFTKASIEKYHI
ncbi:hypothetical protein HHI36_008097 [Cryptolaemus montrouzieri]|uniref:RING finger protein 37 n=1 Tax=Cryptolaemus montrouzieri TaxID=559131 RepID=A0ABD2MRS1_9CUCU